jgi:hypothetical protein
MQAAEPGTPGTRSRGFCCVRGSLCLRRSGGRSLPGSTRRRLNPSERKRPATLALPNLIWRRVKMLQMHEAVGLNQGNVVDDGQDTSVVIEQTCTRAEWRRGHDWLYFAPS